MGDFVTALLNLVSIGALWGSITAAATITTAAILVSFGYHVLKKAIKGIGKGKARI